MTDYNRKITVYFTNERHVKDYVVLRANWIFEKKLILSRYNIILFLGVWKSSCITPQISNQCSLVIIPGELSRSKKVSNSL